MSEATSLMNNKLSRALLCLFIILILSVSFQPAEGGVRVTPQTVRVCVAQKITDASFNVQGKYRLVDSYSQDIIGLLDDGETWRICLSGNRMEVYKGHMSIGSFVGPLVLEEIQDRVYLMSGNGSVVQKEDARELAIQGNNGSVGYVGGELSEFWAQGAETVSVLKPSGVLNLVDIRVGAGKTGQVYRGGFEFRTGENGLLIINQLDIEEYLYGVVPAEMPAKFPFEAIKAQAVVARSYLISSLGNYSLHGFDILAQQNSQVYKGYLAENPVTSRAVDATRGEILVFRGQPVPAFFHSCSGGYTENSEDVWGSFLPYIRAKVDPLDRCEGNAKYYNWEVSYSQDELLAQLLSSGYDFRQVDDLRIIERTSPGKRVKKLLVSGVGPGGSYDTVEITGADKVRKALGLNSAMFAMEKEHDSQGLLQGVTITGNGWGHGLGMSQWGARGMAEQGYNYREILQYYYTGVSIASDYGL